MFSRSAQKGHDREILEACIRQHCPGVAGSIRFKPIPTGKFNTSYYVQADDTELVLRIAPDRNAVFLFYERDMMRQEPGIHMLLLEKTTVPVARILAYDDSQTIIDRNFLIMERLPGTPLSDGPCGDVAAVLRQVGESLAQSHRLTADQYGYLGEHRPMPPQPTWIEAFLCMWRKLIEDVQATGHYSEEESSQMLALLDHFLPVFDRNPPASLLHMDVWGQNILVDGSSRLTGLLDWDRALWGDPEIEFAVLDYCGISEPAFWEGYGTPRDQSREAAIRNLFYLLYEVQKYIVIRHGRSKDPAAAVMYKRQVMQLVRHLKS